MSEENKIDQGKVEQFRKKLKFIDEDNIDHWFTHHPPRNSSEIEAYERIREAAKQFAKVILYHTPSCPDQTVAIRRVREAVMIANGSIACEGR